MKRKDAYGAGADAASGRDAGAAKRTAAANGDVLAIAQARPKARGLCALSRTAAHNTRFVERVGRGLFRAVVP